MVDNNSHPSSGIFSGVARGDKQTVGRPYRGDDSVWSLENEEGYARAAGMPLTVDKFFPQPDLCCGPTQIGLSGQEWPLSLHLGLGRP